MNPKELVPFIAEPLQLNTDSLGVALYKPLFAS